MKYALITGASGGIGSAIAKGLAKDGYNLYLHYNQNERLIDELIAQLHGVTNVYKVKADLSMDTGVTKIINSINHEIDVLVLTGGNSYVGLMTDMTDPQVEEMIQLHLTSPFLLTKRLLCPMVRKKAGKIVVISSIWGSTGASCEVLYSTLKGALNTFVKALAKEVAPSGINVNGVAPGAIDTKMLSIFSSEDLQVIKDEIPMGRLGTPQEVADLVLFLTSEKASYINGQIININGAWYC